MTKKWRMSILASSFRRYSSFVLHRASRRLSHFPLFRCPLEYIRPQCPPASPASRRKFMPAFRALGRLLTRQRFCRLLAVALVLAILFGFKGLPAGDQALAGDKEKKFRPAPELTGGAD